MALSTKLIRGIQRQSGRRSFRSQGGYTVKVQMRMDASRVKRKMDKWENAILFKVGGWVRTRIKRSMRTGKKQARGPYRPRPPYAWRGLLRDLVLFDVDLRRSRVEWGVGKVKTSTKSRKGVPRLLEEGGTATIEQIYRRRSEPAGFIFLPKRARFRKFPYIAPQKKPAIKFFRQKVKELQLGD